MVTTGYIGLQDLLSRFDGAEKRGKGHMACCPCHDDDSASLSIIEHSDGIGLKCFAGCTTNEICEAIGITAGNLQNRTAISSELNQQFGERLQKHVEKTATPKKKKKPLSEWTIEAEFEYANTDGKVLFKTVKFRDPDDGTKTFRQYRKEGDQWKPGLKDVEPYLYRLSAFAGANSGNPATIFVHEGEKASLCNPARRCTRETLRPRVR